MRSDEVLLLADQLAQALDEMDNEMGEPAEIATLGGLLARYQDGGVPASQNGQPGDELATRIALLLTRASACRAKACAALQETIAREGPICLAQSILGASENDSADECADALFELDELLAAAWFADVNAPELADLADLVVRTVRAFPAVWRELSALASEVLARHPRLQPPAARALWAAVEAAQWLDEFEPTSAPACHSILGELRLRIRCTLPRRWGLASSLPQADSTALPAQPPWQMLDQGAGWELALTLDEEDRPILLLAGLSLGKAARIECNGREVPLLTPRPGVVTCRAEPGTYRLHLAGEVREYEVEE